MGKVLKVVQSERHKPTPHESCSSLPSPTAATRAAVRALRSLIGIVSTMGFVRYRRKAKSGAVSGG
ncbi:hypothetical protein SGPA1_50260 [Streptomyces misionensis JCM 4497]